MKIGFKIISICVLLSLQTVSADVSDRKFFGENEAFVDIMSGKASKELIALQHNKQRALEIYKDSLPSSGLELKMSASDKIDTNFKGYSASLEWNLFDGGLFGYQKESKQKALEYAAHYDEILNDAQSNYLRASIYEINEIKSNIDGIFNHQKLAYIEKEYSTSKRKLTAGLITKYRYNKIKNLYKKANRMPRAKGVAKKIFDKKFEAFILHIENTKLWNEKELIEKAKLYNSTLNAQHERINAQKQASSWVDDVEASLHISKRRYTFIDREDTLVGGRMTLPLELKKSDELARLNQHVLKLKIKSQEVLLEKKIHYFYTNFLTNLDEIKDKKGELQDFSASSDLEKAQKLEIKQNIWALRCEALKNLLHLQYETGVKLFQ